MAQTLNSKASKAAFDADLAHFDDLFAKADAVCTDENGFRWIDRSRIDPEVHAMFTRFLQYGYANGLIS